MRIEEVIELLLALKTLHGNIEVFFDCPHCGKSNKPTEVVAVGMFSGK